jgi:hypothetical protein
VLNSPEVRELWSNPILRVSNVLDELFHERVILCEADSDCRFYSTVFNNIRSGVLVRDPFFVPVFGKDRFPTLIKAFTQLHVPLRVVGDFDLLGTTDKVKETFAALGGSWSDVEMDYKSIDSALRGKTPPLSFTQVCDKIRAVIHDVETGQE